MFNTGKQFIWGQTPPKWFMKRIAEAFRLMGVNREIVHAVDVSQQFTIIISIAPRDQSHAIGVEIGELYKRRFPSMTEDPPA